MNLRKFWIIVPVVLALFGDASLEAKIKGQKCDQARCKKNFEQIVTLDVVDINNTPQDLPVDIEINVEIMGNAVFIHVPAFNFTLPVDGAVFTASGFLPECIWPADLVPQSFSLDTDTPEVEFDLYVTNAGSLLIYAEGGGFIPAGGYSVHATTLVYLLTDRCDPCKAPENIKISDGTSNAAIIFYGGEFLEFYTPSIIDNHFAICWPSNTVETSPNGRDHFDMIVRTGTVCENGSVQLNKAVTVMKAPYERFYFLEASVVINPANTDHIVVVTTGIDRSSHVTPTDPNRFQLWRGVSEDGGETWSVARLDGTFGLPLIPRDGVTPVFDNFGNLWVPYLFATDTSNFLNPINIVFALSQDGGYTWQNAGVILTPIINPSLGQNLFDYLHASFGGDGQGGKALWASATYYRDDISSPYGYVSEIYVAYISVYGLGSFDPPVIEPIPQTIYDPANFPELTGTVGNEILATQDGKVFIVGHTFDTPTTSNRNHLHVNPNGIVNFGANSFSDIRAVYWTNVSKGNTIIPFAPRRSILNMGPQLGYDEELGRLYVGEVDMRPDFSGNMVCLLVHTDDDGLTWSKERPIANRSTQARGILGLALDPFTGNMVFNWFDARGQEDQAEVNTFMSILTRQQLEGREE